MKRGNKLENPKKLEGKEGYRCFVISTELKPEFGVSGRGHWRKGKGVGAGECMQKAHHCVGSVSCVEVGY